ncbi:NACHT domain-containing protein [Rhodococcus qingshengii]|uniref:NACHT domain-containing protein n=1 Tax=Rhodococcus qingshengii TaxID=334542 RepID=UPI001BE6D0C4|nr:NACHT domain-containing protein [Rhodococcus qingshengii]MBT2275601.1 NACHT domain-containing protein [Rhodococcus qingshengii]
MASLTLGATATKWIMKSVAGDGFIGDITSDAADLVHENVSSILEQKRANRQIEQIGEAVAKRLQPYIDSEHSDLPQNEIDAATTAVNDMLLEAGTGAQIVVNSNLDPTLLEFEIRKTVTRLPADAHLGEGAESLFNTILAEVCVCICRISESLPNFTHAFAAEVLERESTLIDKTNEILMSLPETRVPATWGQGTESARFENRYLESLSRRLDVLQLYGADIPEEKNRYSLSVAYISLTASRPGELKTENRISNREIIAEDDRELYQKQKDINNELDFVRVETALGGSDHVIIGGPAGSGKTTLLQWIAVTASRSSFTGDLSQWNGIVPFRIQLRQFTHTPLPAPEEFVTIAVPNIADTMPTGWVHQLLSKGRALLLVDGLDELPEPKRATAHTWLNEILTDFPQTKVVVTSRTAALTKKWTNLRDFRHAELLPMQIDDVRAFISHWHRAAKSTQNDPSERERIDIAERHLLTTVQENRTIRSLSTSPLLCALICALHRDKVNKLPDNRMELYETALRMLLVTRDRERDVLLSEKVPLNFAQRKVLLRDFALWLLENGASEAPEEMFIARVNERSNHLTTADSNGPSIATDLLDRSGVLRRPVEGQVDFVHRTFLEYLAAEALIQDDSIGKIVAHSHLDQWRETVILAAGHANAKQRERLITEIIARGESEPRKKHHLYLVAVACMETSPELSPTIKLRLEECLQEVVPPQNMTEAASIASAGALAVDKLRGRQRYAKHAAASVRALSIIAVDYALEALSEIGSDERVTVARQLIRAWPQFDGEKYAKRVLADSPLDNGIIVLSDLSLLPHTKYLKNLSHTFIDCPGKINNLDQFSAHSTIFGIDASRGTEFEDLRPLSSLTKLQSLYLTDCKDLKSLEGIEESSLHRLDIEGCIGVRNIDPVSTLHNLRILDISRTGVQSLEPIRNLENLKNLTIASANSLTSLGDCIPARYLSIVHCKSLYDISAISKSPTLEIISYYPSKGAQQDLHLHPNTKRLSFSASDPRARIRGGDGIQTVTLSGEISKDLWDDILQFKNLRILAIYGSRLDFLEFGSICSIETLEEISISITPIDDSVYTTLQDYGFRESPSIAQHSAFKSWTRKLEGKSQ